ncbi:hypothetical protein YB2330_005161 [Saitoella coloradoensis]
MSVIKEDVEKAEHAIQRAGSPTNTEKADIQRVDYDHSSNPSAITATPTEHLDNDNPHHVLSFAPNDPDNPRNWPTYKRYYIASFASLLNVLVCLCASGYSSGGSEMGAELGMGSEVVTVGLSLYVLGFALGPMVLAPLSEYYGRNPVYITTWTLFTIFQIPLALAQNTPTVLICRFLQGTFGSAPLTNTGGTVSDVFARDECGYAMAIYGLSSAAGPPFALVISGWIVLQMGWRWLFWVYLIVFGGIGIIMLLTLPETRHDIILARRAKKLGMYHPHQDRKLRDLFGVTLTRPVRFLFTEPITFFSAIYNGFLFGVVFLFNEALPIVFADGHGFNVGEWGLTFLGFVLGSLVAALCYPIQERHYLRKVKEAGGKSVPEERIWSSLLGTFLLPFGLFWFAWTSYPSVPWIIPILAAGCFGAGLFIIILGILNYVVDAYQTYAASALAGVILVRNVVGAGFPLFAAQMYEGMGPRWATSLLGFLSLGMCCIPFLFYFWGRGIRRASPWAREHFDTVGDATH